MMTRFVSVHRGLFRALLGGGDSDPVYMTGLKSFSSSATPDRPLGAIQRGGPADRSPAAGDIRGDAPGLRKTRGLSEPPVHFAHRLASLREAAGRCRDRELAGDLLDRIEVLLIVLDVWMIRFTGGICCLTSSLVRRR